MVKGKAAIGSDVERYWQSRLATPRVITVEVKRLGSLDTHARLETFSLKTNEPTPKELTGKYVVVWEKVRGRWKLAADIWNDGK